MNVGDKVEIKEHDGGTWIWPEKIRAGQVTDIDKHCYSVRTDDGESIRDVHDHFRSALSKRL